MMRFCCSARQRLADIGRERIARHQPEHQEQDRRDRPQHEQAVAAGRRPERSAIARDPIRRDASRRGALNSSGPAALPSCRRDSAACRRRSCSPPFQQVLRAAGTPLAGGFDVARVPERQRRRDMASSTARRSRSMPPGPERCGRSPPKARLRNAGSLNGARRMLKPRNSIPMSVSCVTLIAGLLLGERLEHLRIAAVFGEED